MTCIKKFSNGPKVRPVSDYFAKSLETVQEHMPECCASCKFEFILTATMVDARLRGLDPQSMLGVLFMVAEKLYGINISLVLTTQSEGHLYGTNCSAKELEHLAKMVREKHPEIDMANRAQETTRH